MGRRFARSVVVAAMVIGLVAVGGPQPASAVSGCKSGPSASTADVSIGQGTAGTTNTSGDLVVTYVIGVANAGPCPLPTLTIHDDLPAAVGTWSIVATNPSSWINGCSTTSGATPGSFDCFFNAGLGVPANGTITLAVTFAGTPANTTNFAAITAPVAGVNCDPNIAVCEVN